MGDAKRIEVKPISVADARKVVKQHHYSGKVVNNSQLHLGVFLDGRCGGAMQFGPSLDKRKMVGLVSGTPWNGFIELNRMAFADWLPRNSESRAIGYAMRWMRKTYPFIQWVVSFADGCQCGDGTIYRASGFVLTGIKVNNQMWAPVGVTSRISVTKGPAICTASMRPGIGAITNGAITNGASSMKRWVEAGYAPLPGFQLRYLYFIDPTARERLTVPVLPFSEIDRMNAGMYKGKPRARSIPADAPAVHAGEDGAAPIRALST